MNGEETRFKPGNNAAEKWTKEEVQNIIEEMRNNAMNDQSVLSLQDAILSVNLYTSSLNYLLDKFPEFENIKNDISDIIISRINKKALLGDYNATASIWRFKQLGEKDKIETETKNVNFNAEVTKEEAKRISDALEDEY